MLDVSEDSTEVHAGRKVRKFLDVSLQISSRKIDEDNKRKHRHDEKLLHHPTVSSSQSKFAFIRRRKKGEEENKKLKKLSIFRDALECLPTI